MIQLISLYGKSAQSFYLEQGCISDFKALIRTVTSGRVMIISTRFRSDLFYKAEESKRDELLSLWALYANSTMDSLDPNDCKHFSGDEPALSHFFQSMQALSINRHEYNQYKKAFYAAYSYDQQNPMAVTIVQCDQYLVGQPSIKREPLCESCEKIKDQLTGDTLALAMRILNNDSHSN
ncbi:MAG: hypothetical protein ABJF11_15225 [Reichenbachiella sp.]|uniref:hypothetical protein n=1 Tax=Reichenbachiella sp. TaxID=2184521 RepID=UPI0032656370